MNFNNLPLMSNSYRIILDKVHFNTFLETFT